MACYREVGETPFIWDDFGIFEPYGYFSYANDTFALRADLADVATIAEFFPAGTGPGGDNRITSIAVDDQHRVVLTQRLQAFNTHLGVAGPAYAVWRIDDPDAATPSDFTLLQEYPGFSNQPLVAWGHDAGVMFLTINTFGLYTIDVDTGATTLLRSDHHGGRTVTPDGAVWGFRTSPFRISRYDPDADDYDELTLTGFTSDWSELIPRTDSSVSVQLIPGASAPESSVRISPAMVLTQDPCMASNLSRAFRAVISTSQRRTYHVTSGSGGGTPYPAVYEWGAQAWHVGHFYHRG